MKISFSKYEGTGNDFIIVDQMSMQFPLDTSQVAYLCHRRFGIGADGVILLQPSDKTDFRMVYYNADGKESSMCGNGGRCLVHFAYTLNYTGRNAVFEAIDGIHQAAVLENAITLHMNDVKQITEMDNSWVLDTGSPHYVQFISGVETADVVKQGREIRNSGPFREHGINVNLAEEKDDGLFVRTYERGVEDETLSCGTGVTAVVIAASEAGILNSNLCVVTTRGGELSVEFSKENNIYNNIRLTGPVTCVFKGEIDL